MYRLEKLKVHDIQSRDTQRSRSTQRARNIWKLFCLLSVISLRNSSFFLIHPHSFFSAILFVELFYFQKLIFYSWFISTKCFNNNENYLFYIRKCGNSKAGERRYWNALLPAGGGAEVREDAEINITIFAFNIKGSGGGGGGGKSRPRVCASARITTGWARTSEARRRLLRCAAMRTRKAGRGEMSSLRADFLSALQHSITLIIVFLFYHT